MTYCEGLRETLKASMLINRGGWAVPPARGNSKNGVGYLLLT